MLHVSAIKSIFWASQGEASTLQWKKKGSDSEYTCCWNMSGTLFSVTISNGLFKTYLQTENSWEGGQSNLCYENYYDV